MKKVLMIARAFPPFYPVGFSIRVVKFIKFLPALGWIPTVLTIDDQKEYETARKMGSETLLSEIHPHVKIYRTASGEPSLQFLEKEKAFCRRNLFTAIIGKFFSGARRWTFRNILLPDRYITWLPSALRQGRQIVKSEGIDVIFATCPPHSATLIGAFLKRVTGKPLILDFRDDWVGTPWYHSKPAIIRMIDRRMERWAVKTADKVILVTDWSRNAFLARYPTQPRNKFVFISNGCDLGEFAELSSMTAPLCNSKFTIVHAGSLNVSNNWGRNPVGLFQAIRHILQQEPEMAERLMLLFAGDLPEAHRRSAAEIGLSGLIRGLGHLPHDDVLRLLKSADLLLAINYDNFSTIIPGKIYEYWAVGGPPILLLSCPGAASNLVERYGLGFTVDPSDVAGIQQAILTAYRRSKAAVPLRVSTVGIKAYDRQELTYKLAKILSMSSERQQ